MRATGSHARREAVLSGPSVNREASSIRAGLFTFKMRVPLPAARTHGIELSGVTVSQTGFSQCFSQEIVDMLFDELPCDLTYPIFSGVTFPIIFRDHLVFANPYYFLVAVCHESNGRVLHEIAGRLLVPGEYDQADMAMMQSSVFAYGLMSLLSKIIRFPKCVPYKTTV